MIITTEFSRYELDAGNKRLRRLSSSHGPTANQPGNEWRTYETIEGEVAVGRRPIFVWGLEGPRFEEAIAGAVLMLRRTQLSAIQKVEGDG